MAAWDFFGCLQRRKDCLLLTMQVWPCGAEITDLQLREANGTQETEAVEPALPYLVLYHEQSVRWPGPWFSSCSVFLHLFILSLTPSTHLFICSLIGRHKRLCMCLVLCWLLYEVETNTNTLPALYSIIIMLRSEMILRKKLWYNNPVPGLWGLTAGTPHLPFLALGKFLYLFVP